MSPLSESHRQLLLRLARRALEESVQFRPHSAIPEVKPTEGPLVEPCGAFVSLHIGGRLRGCIGYVQAQKPLYRTVCECARDAALHDPRFRPVVAEELPKIHLEISLLSPMEDISPDQVEVGHHGLMVSRGPYRGLLLPQVAVEFRWDREKFLEETCVKAGLSGDAWKHGARIQAFTAQVFGEPRHSAPASHNAA